MKNDRIKKIESLLPEALCADRQAVRREIVRIKRSKAKKLFDEKLKTKLGVRSKINLQFQALRRSHGKTQGGRIASYLTDEQRSHAGWIGASKCEVIFEASPY
ncbi:MAG: hypothetical protein JRE64_14175 [Deltaproteobacteria bacterium]|nr:hypothetical protein [Deltaproteobacteria bacterium]